MRKKDRQQAPPSGDSARDKLLEATSQLMIERDTLDITLSEIAERAQVNAGLVHYYFRGKEGLLFALIDRDVAPGVSELSSLVNMDLPPIQKMVVHLTGIIRAYYRNPYLNRLITAMTRDGRRDRVSRVLTELLIPLLKAHTIILESGFEAGVFRKIDPMLFYFTVIGAVDSMYSNRFSLRALVGAERVSEELHQANEKHLINLIMRGILVDGAPYRLL